MDGRSNLLWLLAKIDTEKSGVWRGDAQQGPFIIFRCVNELDNIMIWGGSKGTLSNCLVGWQPLLINPIGK